MTYEQFVEIINMPSVLVMIFIFTGAGVYGVLSLIEWLRHTR